MRLPFEHRADAGRRLAERLEERSLSDPLVLTLPRGGVAVGFEVAAALGAELDVTVVRKLGVPSRPELAMGAIVSGGIRVLNPEVIGPLGIDEERIERVTGMERRELERRERVYRSGRPPAEVSGRTVILVDDGAATGATVLAAIHALRKRDPARLIVALPVAAAETVRRIAAEADEVVCLATPEPFLAISMWYREFSPVIDEEVRYLLERAERLRRHGPAGSHEVVPPERPETAPDFREVGRSA
ncbi:MAG: phosphoribosyltransferase family protein [Gemmatimonadota bacterium]|nr:phosphoribosyltransferase family protein [Gemmatimonadota bacterium]